MTVPSFSFFSSKKPRIRFEEPQRQRWLETRCPSGHGSNTPPHSLFEAITGRPEKAPAIDLQVMFPFDFGPLFKSNPVDFPSFLWPAYTFAKTCIIFQFSSSKNIRKFYQFQRRFSFRSVDFLCVCRRKQEVFLSLT